MILTQIDKNKKAAFQHLVEYKKQNKDTVSINGNEYSYTTKKGIVKKYIRFNSFAEFQKSELYPHHAERVEGFYFVALI